MRRLLGDALELKLLNVHQLKGFDTPVRAWAVLCEAETETRFEASRSSPMAPFVGREPEVALLLDRWRDARSGEGKVALLSGDAGIGKSRILATLRERIADEPHLGNDHCHAKSKKHQHYGRKEHERKPQELCWFAASVRPSDNEQNECHP